MQKWQRFTRATWYVAKNLHWSNWLHQYGVWRQSGHVCDACMAKGVLSYKLCEMGYETATSGWWQPERGSQTIPALWIINTKAQLFRRRPNTSKTHLIWGKILSWNIRYTCSKHMRGYIGVRLIVSLIHLKTTMCVRACASICSKLSK